jgi:uncharacterized membrane protein
VNRWLAGGLIVSLVLNLAVAGFIVGRYLAGPPPSMPPTGLRWMLDGVPDPERREALRPLVRAGMREFGAAFAPMRRSQQGVHDALVVEPFDADLLTGRLAEMRRELDAMQARTHATLVQVAAAMTPAERQVLAEALRRPFVHPDVERVRVLRERGGRGGPPGGPRDEMRDEMRGGMRGDLRDGVPPADQLPDAGPRSGEVPDAPGDAPAAGPAAPPSGADAVATGAAAPGA